MSDEDRLAKLEKEATDCEQRCAALCAKMLRAMVRFQRELRAGKRLATRIKKLWSKICGLEDPPLGQPGESDAKGGVPWN